MRGRTKEQSILKGDKMKITKIELMKLQVPFAKPYLTSGGLGTTATQIIVKVHTDEGIVGLGETEAFAKHGCTPEMAMFVISQVLGPAVLGHDPLDIREIYTAMDKAVRDLNSPKAAIDIACLRYSRKKSRVFLSTPSWAARREIFVFPPGPSAPRIPKAQQKTRFGPSRPVTRWLV